MLLTRALLVATANSTILSNRKYFVIGVGNTIKTEGW